MTIEHELLRIGRIMAADQNITVECRGLNAYATPGRIVIPSIENLDYLGPDAERMLHGYLDHECGHACDTDFDLYQKALEKSKAFKLLFNALEDGYIEARRGHLYKGCQYNLAQKNKWFWEREDERGVTTPTLLVPASEPIPNGVKRLDLWSQLTLAINVCVKPYGGQQLDDIKALNPELWELVKECESEIEEIRNMGARTDGSIRCYRIAEELYERFQNKKTSDKKEDEGEEPPLPLFGSLDEWDSDEGPLDPEHAIGAAIVKALVDPENGTQKYVVFSHDYDWELDFTGDVAVSGKWDTLERETALVADAFVLAFEAALRAKMNRTRQTGLDEGAINSDMLVEFAAGSAAADVIYEQYEAEMDDTGVALGVLVDCSGSMGDYDDPKSPARLAAQTAAAIYKAASICQLESEIAGFTTVHNDPWYAAPSSWRPPQSHWRGLHNALLETHRRGQNLTYFARTFHEAESSGIENSSCHLLVPAHAVFKRFGSNDARGLSHITGQAANLDGEAVLWMARRLAKRPERRRVLFVLSDGRPSAARPEVDQAGYLKEVVGRAIEAGIEVYGIGMRSNAVRQFYPQCWVADKLTDLVEIAMGALTDVLIENRQEQQWVTL